MTGGLFGSMLSNKFVVGFIVLSSPRARRVDVRAATSLTLQSSLNNRLATAGGIGYSGAFALGLVTALIAAPCTGPVLAGMLLWIATTKSFVLGSVMMFTFACGLGVPFFLVGTFLR